MKWDWDYLVRLALALFFLVSSGVLLALGGGWLAILMIFDVFFGGSR